MLRIFTGLNALIGLLLIAQAAWPSSDPTIEKNPITVVIYLVWAFLFLWLTRELFYVTPFARKWTIGLYGAASAATLWGLASDIIKQSRLFFVSPGLSISIYLIFFAFFIWPIMFMLHEDVKEYFLKHEQNRMKLEEESGRATFKGKN